MNNTIYVVRHGQTDWNVQGLLQGRADNPLNEVGRQQAHKTAAELKGIKFDAAYSSPLCRASETCEIILKDNEFGGAILLDDRIRERNFGPFEGGLVPEYLSRDPWNIDKENLDGAEPISDVMNRVHNFLDEIKANHSNKNILITCHSGAMRAIYFYFNEFPQSGDLYKEYRAGNAAVSIYNL